jgi:AcrR family transcriptional regulator
MTAGNVNEFALNSGSPQRRHIVRAAGVLFAKQGYTATSTREVAEIIGVQKASLYHHFRSKEDLLYLVCTEALQSVRRAVESALARANGTYIERLQVAADAHLCTALADKGVYALMLRELNQLSPERRDTIIAMRSTYEKLFEGPIQAGQDAGEIRSDLSARFITLGLLNTLNWTMYWYDPSQKMSLAEISDGLVSIFVDGARAR